MSPSNTLTPGPAHPQVHLPDEPPADRLSLAGGSANRGGVLQMTDEQLLEAFPPSVRH